MSSFSFTVPGRPRGKGRPRFSPFGGRPFTPKATRDAEKAIATVAMLARRAAPLMTGTVELSVEAIFKVPKSWSSRLRVAALAGDIEYTGKPDGDNILKLILDSLNGVIWLDDAQVNRASIVRRYGEAERVEVTIEETVADDRVKSPAERRREAKRDGGNVPAKLAKRRQKATPITSKEHAIFKRIRKPVA